MIATRNAADEILKRIPLKRVTPGRQPGKDAEPNKALALKVTFFELLDRRHTLTNVRGDGWALVNQQPRLHWLAITMNAMMMMIASHVRGPSRRRKKHN